MSASLPARGYFREVEAGDIAHVAANLRPADRLELAAVYGDMTVPQAIAHAVLVSSHAWAGVGADREPICIIGVAPLSIVQGKGSPWMLATERAYAYPRVLVREGRRYIQKMLAMYPHLENYVDARNERSVRWLARIGFTIHDPLPFGPQQLPFHRFEMRA